MLLNVSLRPRAAGLPAAVAVLALFLAAAPGLRSEEAQPAPPPAVAAPAAASAQPAASSGMMPEVISTYGQSVDDLWWLIVWITLVAFIAVEVLLVVFLIRYRHRDGRRASYTHGHRGLEVVWTVVTAGILVFIAIIQRSTWAHIKEELPGPEKNPLLVRVFGEQFNWHFVYAGADGKFETNREEDMFGEENPIGLKDPKADVYRRALLVPVDVPVILELNSLPKFEVNTGVREMPVLHSFFSANLRIKQDLVPYHPGKIWFQATRTGTFEIVCAELCGQNHYTMRADMKVMTADELKTALGYDWQAARATQFPEMIREKPTPKTPK
jgi:cytochrome c oxidase subunit 2